MSLDKDLQKLQDLFEGVDPGQQDQIKDWRKSLKMASLKANFQKNPVMKLIFEDLERQIKLCEKILLTDRGGDRDPVADKIFRMRVAERMDNMNWFIGLFGDNEELKTLRETVKKELDNNKEFLGA